MRQPVAPTLHLPHSDFASEVGLVVLIHNDMDVPFAKEGSEPVYLGHMKALLLGIRTQLSFGLIWVWAELSADQESCRYCG